MKPVSPQQLRDPKSFAKRDCFGEDLIYRRFKVSGGMNLDTFQDKVLQPIMGWSVTHTYVRILFSPDYNELLGHEMPTPSLSKT